MPGVMLRPAVRQDLEDIWDYTEHQWGEQQADTYIRQLHDGFVRLAETPEAGQDCSAIRQGYRKHPVERHLIFYRIVAERGIEIVRILHEHMDVERHLPE